MKQIILLTICLLSLFEMNAQHKINKEVLQFITKQHDTVSIYSGDIKIIDDISIQLIDAKKMDKLKETAIDKVCFIDNTGKKSRVWFQGIFASSVPDGDLYILALGDKVHIFKDSIIQCSKELLQKIKSTAFPN